MRENKIVRLSDNNKYFVVKSSVVDGDEYAYLLQIGEKANFVLLKCESDGLNLISDTRERVRILTSMQLYI